MKKRLNGVLFVFTLLLTVFLIPQKAHAYTDSTGYYNYTFVEGGVCIELYKGYDDATIKIPSYLDGYKVVTIGDFSFHDHNEIKSVTIPNTVKKIEYGAFQNCDSLTTVKYGTGLKELSDAVFSFCDGLKTMKVPKSVTVLGHSVFYYCSKLESVEFLCDLDTLSFQTFIGCSSLKSVTLPANLKTIDTSAFNGCASLKTIKLPTSLKVIKDSAFNNCASLATVELPKNLQSLGSYSFGNCSKLQKVTVKGMNTSFDTLTFQGCSKLKEFSCYKKSTAVTYAKEKGYKVSYINTNYKITVPKTSKTVVYGSGSFKLNAKTNTGKKLTYTSSSKKVVTVDKNGKVKIVGCGKATITIKSAVPNSSKTISKKVTVTVNPKKVTLSSVSSPAKKTILLKWKKSPAITGYQVDICKRKNFTEPKTRFTYVDKKNADPVIIKGTVSESGKTYYVRVRAYKTFGGKTYFGAWSNVKSVRTK